MINVMDVLFNEYHNCPTTLSDIATRAHVSVR